MKKTHWSGMVATTLISLSAMAGCSGDDAPPVNGAAGMSSGGSGTAGSGTAGSGTSGSGTAGSGTSGSGTGGSGSSVGVQLQAPDYYVKLEGADAPAPSGATPGGYTAGFCSSCHGDSGEGNVVGPEIRYVPKDYLLYLVRNGRMTPSGSDSGMPKTPASTVSDTDVDAVAAWLASAPKPTTGAGLYKAMCGNCHGPMMPTGGSAPINIQGVEKAELTKYVRMGNGTDVANRKEYMPKYDTTLLTDAELDLIGTFIGAK